MENPIEAIKTEVERSQQQREREQQVFDWLCDNPKSMRYIVWHLLYAGYLSVYEVAEMREQGHRVEIDNILKQYEHEKAE